MSDRESRDSDADEFHDALEHLEDEEEEEENELRVAVKEVVAKDEVAAAVSGEDNEPPVLQSNSLEVEPPIINITHPAADEKASANPAMPSTRQVTEQFLHSVHSATNSLYREGSIEESLLREYLLREGSSEERILLETQSSDELLLIPSNSLFDALSGSGSEELENAELANHTLWNSLSKSSAGIDNIETQDSVDKQEQTSIDDDDEESTGGSVLDDGSDSSNSDESDIAVNIVDEEGEVEQTEQLLAEGGADSMQNHEPDTTEREVIENCRDPINTTFKEEEDEAEVSIIGISKDKEEEQGQAGEVEGKVEEDDVEEVASKATVSTKESSLDTPTKEVQELQLDEKKTITDESSEQLIEEQSLDVEESGDEPTMAAAKSSPQTTAEEQVVIDGDYVTPRKIDCGEFCDMGSPLEALFLYCQGKKLGLDIDLTEEGIEVPLRTSSFTDADPKLPAPLSPVDGHQHDYDSDSSDDSSLDSVVKFKMINKDTGSLHDMRNIMRDIDEKGSSDAIDTQYSIFPNREILEYHQRLSAGSNEMNHLASRSFDESLSTLSHSPKTGSPTSARKKASELTQKLKRGVAGLKSSKKHHRKRIVTSEELPGNAVYVRSSMAQKTARMRLATSSSEESPTQNATDSSFNPMLLVKTIQAHNGPAWCAAFSKDGSFLATGGEDGNVTIWSVSPKSTKLHPKGVQNRGENQNGDQNNDEKSAPLSFIGLGPELATNLEIISSEPVQRFRDHTADVIDLSWSHTNFLLTASVDKSVRLYHFSKSNCLHLFKHANLVASVDFHPFDDRYFISGGLDKKLRLWNITDGRVKDWAQAPEVITSTRFTPDGKYAVAGLLRGQVYLYEADGLKYYTQIACRNRSGKNRKGKKVTGISFLREADDKSERSGEERNPSLTERLSETGRSVANLVATKVLGNPVALSTRRTDRMLVSTNDSRVRLYGLNDFCMIRKYKGHTNNSMQIRARASESGSHIACGSESGHCFIWDVDPNKNRLKKSMINKQIQSTKDKTKSTNYFEASKASLPIVTDTLFFPTNTVRESLLTSKEMLPLSLGMDRIDDDFSSAAILTLDYDGTIRVFIRKTCIDNILEACTPRGGTMA